MKRFTLIELMIVVAIIAIIASIAIPSLLRSRIAANETSAVGSLKQLTSHEASWRQTDADRNGLKDNWCLDVASFRFMLNTDGDQVNYIDAAFAKADASPQITTQATSGKSGYVFQSLTTDEDGAVYAINTFVPAVGGIAAATACCNNFKFGFTARPEVYGTTGVNTFIVNEDGQIYQKDFATITVGTYPGDDPTTVATVPRWGIVE